MASPSSVVVDCGSENDFDGRIGLRVSALFVMLVTSLAAAAFPVFAKKNAGVHVPESAFFVAKYFGSGVIIATAFIHLLAPANDALSSPCLSGPITEYDWAEGIALMTVFSLFLVELLAARAAAPTYSESGDADMQARAERGLDADRKYEVPGLEPSEPAPSASAPEPPSLSLSPPLLAPPAPASSLPAPGPAPASPALASKPAPSAPPSFSSSSSLPLPPSHPPHPSPSHPPQPAQPHAAGPRSNSHVPGEDHLGHARRHPRDAAEEARIAQVLGVLVLEFGVVFHSVFVGLTLAVSGGSQFNTLYVVLVFHQTFEGLGLGARLASAPWGSATRTTLPYWLALGFALSAPVGLAAGLAARTSYAPGSPIALMVSGVADSVSAGVLLYTGLVELMAHEFMFSEAMRRARLRVVLAAFALMCAGAALMALLGKWA